MRHYEMMVIVSDALDDEAARALVDRIESMIRDVDGQLRATDFWGKRPLAYEIDDRHYGYYAVFDMDVTTAAIAEVERQLKIHDDVVRYKSIRPDVRVHKPKAPRPRQLT